MDRLQATRYVTPLREGGSLPAIVEAEDETLWVVKFRGAGQGAKALIAEVIVGALLEAAGVRVPARAVVRLGPEFGRAEPDPEIQDILAGSRGDNFAMAYLAGGLNYDGAAAAHLIGPDEAADLVWCDAFLTNPDRTHRNPNLMVHEGQVWAIDHGAALYAHHAWDRVDDARVRAPFQPIEQHVLLGRATDIRLADERCAARLHPSVLEDALALVPDAWLTDDVGGVEFADADAARDRYLDYLTRRLEGPRPFAGAAEEARRRRSERTDERISSRR